MCATSPTFTGSRSFDDGDVGEFARRLHAAVRPEREVAQPLLDLAAGDLHVLRLQRADDLRGREADRGQFLGVDDDVDLARTAADDEHLADAADRLEPAAQSLVGELGDVADRRGAGERDGEDGNGVRVDLLDDRRVGVLRQVAQDGVDPVADFLRRDVDVLLEHELTMTCERPRTRSTAAGRCR